MKRALACLLIGIGFSTAADAQTFCRVEPFRFMHGDTFDVKMNVVVDTVISYEAPVNPQPVQFCSFDIRSGAAVYKPIEIVKKPLLGVANVPLNYRVTYR
ncbi:MAG TPA: hypothetical protein VIL09_13170 [Microvirga sp.]|jgi:hypothetical protein